MHDIEMLRVITQIPLRSRWLLRSGEVELPFLVVTTSEPRYDVLCETINHGKPPVRFTIRGNDWLGYVTDGSIVFDG